MVKLSIGDVAPSFSLPGPKGQVSLEAVLDKAREGVVVYFYPKAMTPGCTTEACDFRDNLASLESVGYSVIGISPDSVASLAKFAERDALNFDLASDSTKEVMEAYGAFGEKKNYGRIVRGVIRSTFVVGKDGKLVLVNYNVRAKGHVERLRRELGIDSGA